MLANLANSLITHKRIKTTLPKAKALRKYVEPLITRSKYDNTHSRRMVFSDLRDKEAVKELFITVADKVGDRPGGYTRIIKLGNRLGDNAEMAMIELVDFNEHLLEEKAKSGKRKRRRRRRGGSKKASEEKETAQTNTEALSEATEEESGTDHEGQTEETSSEQTEDDEGEQQATEEASGEEQATEEQSGEDQSDQEKGDEGQSSEETDEQGSDQTDNRENEGGDEETDKKQE